VKNQRFLAFVLPLLCVLILPAFVSAEGWNLNPWAKKKADSGLYPSTYKSSSSSFGKKPTTWQKVSTGTSNAVSKTTSALNPWKKDTKTPAKVTGSRRPVNMGKQESKSTWYKPTTWFQKDDTVKPGEPQSVNQFLNQKRVPY
jgi:hypothetical protein